jgi:hypothetical protein
MLHAAGLAEQTAASFDRVGRLSTRVARALKGSRVFRRPSAATIEKLKADLRAGRLPRALERQMRRLGADDFIRERLLERLREGPIATSANPLKLLAGRDTLGALEASASALREFAAETYADPLAPRN